MNLLGHCVNATGVVCNKGDGFCSGTETNCYSPKTHTCSDAGIACEVGDKTCGLTTSTEIYTSTTTEYFDDYIPMDAPGVRFRYGLRRYPKPIPTCLKGEALCFEECYNTTTHACRIGAYGIQVSIKFYTINSDR